MKKLTRILTVIMALCLMATLALPAFAAENTLDPSKKVSLTIHKYDFAAAAEDGAWTQGVVAGNGVTNAAAEALAAKYAITGIEFTYLKLADLRSATVISNGIPQAVSVYGFAQDDALLTVLGLDGDDRYEAADVAGDDNWYFKGETLSNALASAMATAPTATKSALESYVASSNGTAMPLTDANGKTTASDMEQGLYIVVETKTPQMTTDTTAPMLLALPMSSVVDGESWVYDLIVYPKNQVGNPTLEKKISVDGEFVHNVTVSGGNALDYQILSTLAPITSEATYMTGLVFSDTIAAGIAYDKDDVILTWYKDADCAEQIAIWNSDSGKFDVVYADNTMTVTLTAAGLAEVNTSDAVWAADSVKSGYSDCTVKITYGATVNSDASVILGDAGNGNKVSLTWERTSAGYTDTLYDDCHAYTYGMDLTKVFTDAQGDFANVSFTLENATDGVWVVASKDTDGIWYVTGTTATEADATVFVPGADGKIIVKGLEADTYTLTEIKTDSGYNKCDPVDFAITVAETADNCTVNTEGDEDGAVQVLAHKKLTASASVSGLATTMNADGNSINALVAMSIVNDRGPDLPQTGDTGAFFLAVFGTLAAVSALVLIIMLSRGRKFMDESKCE